MASDENVNRDSCVRDPNFAIVCSFFEKFSPICGIKHPPFSDLQQMIDSTDETSPELIDLHIRLMRKAKKNVNPERWERTLAKFCYLYHPQDSWELEQYGYKKLNFTQRLKILLCICEAQFDYNIKFKTDVNKLPIDELRLSPIGTDKDGIKYWIHLDEKLDLKLYKENSEDETFELIVTDRAGLADLIETLKSGRDPDRKFEEPSEEEDDEDSEIEEEEEEEQIDGKNENVDEQKELVKNDSSVKSEPKGEKSSTEEALETQALSESEPKPVASEAPVVNPGLCAVNKVQSVSVHSSRADASLPKKPHVDVKTRRFDKSPEVKLRKDKVIVEQAPKQLKPEEFAQHIEKLKSEKILLPLLSSPLPFPEPPKSSIDSLKTKINMKFNMIKPVLTNEVLMSKIEEVKNNKDLYKKVVVKKEDNTVSNYVMQMNKGKESTSRAGKPGLKLEQILKSKLAQKLAANEPTAESSAVAVTLSLTTSTSNQATADSSKTEPSVADADHTGNTGTPIKSQSTDEPSAKRKLSQDVEIETKKPKLDAANSQPTEDTKDQSTSIDNNAGEIEEPLMLVTGVGSGAECQADNLCENQDDGDEREFVLFVNGPGSGIDCNSPNYFSDDDDEREFCMFITGPGTGVECTTGNNESTADEASDKEKPPATLTHKVENILSKTEVDGDRSCTSVGSNEDTPKKTTSPASDDSAEKKKPKLWTIDAICNSNSSKDTSNKEDISCFPNFSFNKDKKPEMSYRNEFSFFNMPRSESKENDTIPTNFYFGSDTQMPPYVAPDARNINNLKSAKSHNVKDIVQLDGGEDKPVQAQVYSTFTNSHSEQAFNLCTRQSSPPPATVATESESEKKSEYVYSDVMNLSTSNEVKLNQNESINSTDAINRKEALSLVEYPSSSSENSQDVPSDGPQNEVTSSSKLVEEKCLPKEAVSVITDHAEHIPESDVSSKTNQNIEPIVEAPVPLQECKSEEAVSEKSIPTADKPVAKNETVQKDENIVKDVPHVEDNEPEPEPGPSLDSTKKSNENDHSLEDNIIETTQTETSLSENLSEKDIVSLVDVDVQKSDELVVETPSKSTPPKKDSTEIPFQSVKDTLPKSEPIRERSLEPEPTQDTLPESQRTPQTNSELPSTQKVIEPVRITDIAEKSKPEVPETDKVVLKKEDLPQQPAEPLDLEKPDSQVVQEKLNDQPKEPSASKFESPESDDDHCALPSPPSPEPVIDNETPSGPVATHQQDISVAISNDGEKSKVEVGTDLSKSPEKLVQERTTEPVVEKSTSQPEESQQEPESAIKPTSVKISEPIEEPKPDDTIVKNQQLLKETSPKPPEEPLSTYESKSKPNEQIIEQSTTPSDDKEQPTLAKEKPKSFKDTTPAAEKTPKPTEKPEKKTKKAKIVAEEATTPSPVLRTSSRIGTRSARKDSLPKKYEEEEEDDRKSNKTTPSKAKTVAEPKTGKRGKAAAKAAKQAVEEEDKKAESPVEPVIPKKPGRGRKKKVVNAVPVKVTPPKAPSTENSSDENASEDEVKPTAKEAVAFKETKLKTPSKATSKKEKKKEDESDKKAALEADNEEEKKPEKTPKTPASKKKAGKRGWFTDLDVSNLESSSSTTPIRQSRRIAQLKIKEQAEGKYVEQVTPTKKIPKAESKAKQQTSVKKNNKTLLKKATKSKAVKEDSDGEDSSYEKSTPSKKKRKKKDLKKKLKSGNTWKARSDSSSEEEVEEDDHFEEDEDDEEIAPHASDHEFSPESDLEDEDFQPVKRARTAHSKPKTEEDKSEQDDLCCQKCRTAEQPEWILLCDKCDEGWHASCLRPSLMSIPEGDWFCPPCQHNLLINSLHKFLKTYDKKVKKRDNEELRRQRLQYVGISTTNIIADFSKTAPTPDEPSTSRKKSSAGKNDVSDNQSSEEEEESEPDEPLYTLRVRRQANVSYTLKEYDEIMNSAIQREYNEEVPQLVPTVSEQTKLEVDPVAADKPRNKESVKPEGNEDEEKSSEDDEEEDEGEEAEAEVVPTLFRNIRKKSARLTKLDVSSDDDHYSDEDFKGSSAEDYDDDEYAKSETDSDEARYRKSIREPVRRSTRARVTRYDNDFINDDDSDEDDFEPKKKKKKSRNSDSDSEEEDSTWGKRKRNKYSRAHKSSSSSSFPKKKRRRVVFDGDSDEEKEHHKEKKPKKSRITYGLEVEEDDYPQRRTRGKKINYVENLGSDSEEDSKITSKSRKILSDDDDDYVNEEEDQKSPPKSVKGGAEDHTGGKEKPSESVLENGTKNDVSDCGDGAKSESGSLHELITTNNTGVIRTYSKATATVTPSTNVVKETTDAHQNPKLEPISEAKDLAAANKLAPLEMPSQMTPVVVPPAEPLQVYSGIIKEEGKPMAPKKVDCTNPSLEGMQSMAQSIPQMMSSPSNYSMARKMMPMPGEGAQYAPPNQYGDVGMGYEDAAAPEGMPGPPPPRVIADTQHPLRGMLPSGPPEGVRLGPPNPAQMQMGSRPPHLPPGVGPPSYMRPMMPHNPTSAMMHRGAMPPMMPMSPQMAVAMHMRGPRPQHGPGSMPGMPPMGINQSPPNSMSNQPMETSEPTTKKRGARGKGKKQLEMERVKREAEAAAAAAAAAGQEAPNPGSDEMIPLHMLKPLPGPDMIPAVRPPAGAPAGVTVPTTAYNSSPPANFVNYPPPPGATIPGSPNQMTRLPFSTASSTSLGAVTVSPSNTPSKRVKITPTRMRMPGSNLPNVLRFPPRPGQPPQMMHTPRLPMDPSPSGGGLINANSSAPTSAENTPAAAPGTQPSSMVAAEMDAKKRPPSAQPAPGSEQQQQQQLQPSLPPQPQQYYQPPSYPPMPPSANPMLRGGFNPRPEFARFSLVAQKSMPPPMYSHPAPMATTGAPTTIISRPATTIASVISGPNSTPAGAAGSSPKSDPATSVNSTTTSAFPATPPYASSTSPGSISTPTSKPTKATATAPAISTAAGAVPPLPPTSAYQALHMKQLPLHPAHSTAPPYNATPPYYAVASMIPNSYPPPTRPPTTSAYGPPPGSMGFPPRQSGFGKSPSPYGAPPPAGPPPSQDQGTATGSTPPTDYQASSQDQPQTGFQYQESIPAAVNDAEFQAAGYEEKGTPATADEQPSGEFGGLVSYFSSQREDDLDA